MQYILLFTFEGDAMNKKIQVLRGIAIIAVVMIHTNAEGIFGVLMRPLLNFSVALFVFLSGYLTKLEISDVKGFYKKRILKVFLPYVIWSIIYTIIYGNYSDFIKNFITAKCCGIYYYLFVYIQLVLITPLVIKLVRSKYRWIGWCITPIAILILRYLVIIFAIDIRFPWTAVNFMFWFIFYYIGILLGNQRIKYNMSKKKTWLLYAITILLSEIEGIIWYVLDNYNMAITQLRFTSMIASVVAILIAYLYIKDDKIKIRENKMFNIMVIIGDCSFGIYLTHILIIYLLNMVPGVNLLFFPMLSLITLIISTLFVLIPHKYLSKKISAWIGF